MGTESCYRCISSKAEDIKKSSSETSFEDRATLTNDKCEKALMEWGLCHARKAERRSAVVLIRVVDVVRVELEVLVVEVEVRGVREHAVGVGSLVASTHQ